MKELSERMKNQNITLIDVRPKEEFKSGHIPTAVSLTISDIKNEQYKISKSKQIVAYCRGEYCVLAAEAAKILSSKGYKVTIMKSDVNTWQESGGVLEI